METVIRFVSLRCVSFCFGLCVNKPSGHMFKFLQNSEPTCALCKKNTNKSILCNLALDQIQEGRCMLQIQSKRSSTDISPPARIKSNQLQVPMLYLFSHQIKPSDASILEYLVPVGNCEFRRSLVSGFLFW